MNEIEVMSKIKREKLDERNYFKTLIEVAYENQMITENDIVNLQMQVLQLIDKRVYKYNGVDSSSVRKEVVEEISNSNNYTISIYLKTFRNPDDIFEIVLLEVIACKLVKRNIQDLIISTAELNEIYLMFEDKEKVKIEEIINEAYKEIYNELILDNEALQKYIKKNLSNIVEIIINAVKQNTLDKVFITQKFIT